MKTRFFFMSLLLFRRNLSMGVLLPRTFRPILLLRELSDRSRNPLSKSTLKMKKVLV
jgi:hypothetical protein